MDFFEAQARAKKRTSRLVLLFVLAVLGTILAMYGAALLITGQLHDRRPNRSRQYQQEYVVESPPGQSLRLWQPQLFAGVTAATLVIVGLGSLYKWSQFSSGGSSVAESVGGRRVEPGTTDLRERRLLNVVEEMAIASGIPVPAVYVLDNEPAINAFAAGLTTNDAVVAVTRGTIEKLNRDELQGVIAHEFSHILNGDMRLNLRIAATIFGILVLGVIGRGVLWSMRNVRSSRSSKNSGGAIVAIFAAGLALVIIGYVGYFFGRLIQAAVSRQREFLADASSVQFTRNPAGITGALKKIGGYALGSTMNSNQSAALGHFFFSQAFRTGLTGFWATHPPLEDRIRAIDATFDGKFFEPPEVVDVAHESFVTAGLAEPPVLPERNVARTAAVAAVGAIGTLTPAQICNAQVLLDSTPIRLRDAAHSPVEVKALLFGMLLDTDAAEVRSRQLDQVARRSTPEVRQLLDELAVPLRGLRDEQRLPLLQLALPTLREIPQPELSGFLETLDELVHADSRVTPFEYAMQRLLTRSLALGSKPGTAVVQYYSFNAVTDDISVVLSVLARNSTSDPAEAPRSFAAGAAQIKLIEDRLRYRDEASSDLAAFDVALDKLANASLPIKQRTLVAAAHVVQADGQVLVCEFELMRAISAALDVPMPPLAATA